MLMACMRENRDSQGGHAPPLITRYTADLIRRKRAADLSQDARMYEAFRKNMCTRVVIT